MSGAARLLPVALMAAVIGCAGDRPTHPLLFLPADVDLVITVRPRALFAGPVGERLLANESVTAALDAFAADTGFDARRHLGAVSVAAEWDPGGPGRWVGVAAARFDRERFAAWIEDQGGTAYRGVALGAWSWPAAPGGAGEWHGGALHGPHLVAGDPEFVAAAIDRADGIGGAVLGDPGWAERIETVDPEAVAWAILTRESVWRAWRPWLDAVLPGGRVGDLLTGVRTLSVELHTPGPIELTLWADLESPVRGEQAAADLRATVRLLRQRYAERYPQARQLLDGTRITLFGGRIRVAVTVPADWLDRAGWGAIGPRQVSRPSR